MNNVTVGVVEDEVIIADNIIDTLEELGYDTVGPALNYTEALEMLEQNKPDILLLDIMLSGKKDGIDLAWKIKEEHPMPFIFLTSHADKATVDRAKQVEPPAYLVKPFNSDELYSAIEIALFNFTNKASTKSDTPVEETPKNYLVAQSLFIKDKNIFRKIPFSDILYLQNEHVYINVVTKGQTYLVRSNMTEYLAKFPSTFFRVHRSYAINTDHLDAINSDYVLVGEHRVPISKNFKTELLDKVNIG